MRDPVIGQFVSFDGVLVGYVENVKAIKQDSFMVQVRTHLHANALRHPRQVGFSDGIPFSIEVTKPSVPIQEKVVLPDKGILNGQGNPVK